MLPTGRPSGCPFDPPAQLRESPALSRLSYADGHVGWLGTSRDAARAVLGDPRFSIRYELLHLPYASAMAVGQLPGLLDEADEALDRAALFLRQRIEH